MKRIAFPYLTFAFLTLTAPAVDEPATLVPPELFAVPEGLEVTVWATTPLLYNPTNIDFDAEGRLWVAEGVNYRRGVRREEGDRIVVLEDTKHEGKADSSHTFVQGADLVAPLGIAVLDNKIVVSQPPDLLVFTDVNGDHKFDPAVDKREVLLTGFNGRNHDHSLHAVTAGPDGLWYINQGNTGAVFTDKSGKTFRIGSPYDPTYGRKNPNKPQLFNPTEVAGQKSDDGRVWIGGFTARMQSDGSHLEIIGHNYRNSFEQTITSLGDVFQSDNDDPPACRVSAVMEYGNAGFASLDGKRSWGADIRPGQTTPVAEWRQEDPGSMPAGDVYGGGSPTGIAFYENGALGDPWRGLLLACEAGRNVVFGYKPKLEGADWKLERFDFLTSNKDKKFAGSDFTGGGKSATNELPTLFRPSDVCVGPDGAIYVADWFDPQVGGHGTLDKAAVGTIYRIAPKGFQSVVPKLDLTTTEGQIAALKSPAVNVRYSGFIRLKAQGKAAVPSVAALLDDENPYIAARSEWLLAQMGEEGRAKASEWLEAREDSRRLVAFRALRRAGEDVVTLAGKLVTDPSAAVRRDVAIALRDVPAAQSVPLLVQIARGYDGVDRAYLEAFGTGSQGKEAEVFTAVQTALGAPSAQWTEPFARLAWRLHVPAALPQLSARILDSGLSDAQRKLALDTIAFTPGREAAEAMIGLTADKQLPLAKDVLWWLNNRRGSLWKAVGLTQLMRDRGLLEEKPAVEIISPEPPERTADFPKVEDIVALTGDEERGRAAVAVCYTCHKIGSQGVGFGPELTQYGATQPKEVIAKAILTPSADIAFNYDGSRVETTDGVRIDGIVATKGDPTVIKCVGGLVQSIAEDKIKSITRMDRSLMTAPETLGLTPQSIADIIAYLKSGEIK